MDTVLRGNCISCICKAWGSSSNLALYRLQRVIKIYSEYAPELFRWGATRFVFITPDVPFSFATNLWGNIFKFSLTRQRCYLFRDPSPQTGFIVEASIIIAGTRWKVQFLDLSQVKSVNHAAFFVVLCLKSSHDCWQSDWIFIEQEVVWVMDKDCVGRVFIQTNEDLVFIRMWTNCQG